MKNHQNLSELNRTRSKRTRRIISAYGNRSFTDLDRETKSYIARITVVMTRADSIPITPDQLADLYLAIAR